MGKSKYRLNLSDIAFVPITHGSAQKKVFLKNNEIETMLTQFAYSRFNPGDLCEMHNHPTMEEYFFVYKGSGTYTIGEEILILREGDFLRIPAKIEHQVNADKGQSLELIYFGIATKK